MLDAPIGIDQQAYHDLVDQAVLYLEALSGQLAHSYDELYTQRIDVDDLGSAAEAIIFAADKLKEQKIKLETYRKELQSTNSNRHGDENLQ